MDRPKIFFLIVFGISLCFNYSLAVEAKSDDQKRNPKLFMPIPAWTIGRLEGMAAACQVDSPELTSVIKESTKVLHSYGDTRASDEEVATFRSLNQLSLQNYPLLRRRDCRLIECQIENLESSIAASRYEPDPHPDGCQDPAEDFDLGSGLIDHSQKMTAAAMQMADMKVWAHRS